LKDYYSILGISFHADSSEINIAFKKLESKFHPDHNFEDEFFKERFLVVEEAYKILSDPYKRGRYDIDFEKYFKNNLKSESINDFERISPEVVKIKKELPYKKDKDYVELNHKKETELSFEDKAWIFVGNIFFIPGLIGLIMYLKYLNEGYTKKSNQVCGLTLWGILALVLLVAIIIIAKGGKP
jgi:curved DNA-binding protein CbpA